MFEMSAEAPFRQPSRADDAACAVALASRKYLGEEMQGADIATPRRHEGGAAIGSCVAEASVAE